jgi:alanine dehydrogenase
VILASAANGMPLAVMDSMEITIQRTGAATAIAARYLARPESAVCTMCGCGNQARIQLLAMCHALPIRKAFAFGLTLDEARSYATIMSGKLGIEVIPTADLQGAMAQSDVCVTCTPAKKALVGPGDVPRGMFIAAVGADSPDKQELDARLLPAASVFGDLLAQCAEVGEFHHGIAQGLVRREDFRGELGALITGQVRGARRRKRSRSTIPRARRYRTPRRQSRYRGRLKQVESASRSTSLANRRATACRRRKLK